MPFIVVNKLNLYFRLRRSLRVKRLQLRVHDNGFEAIAPNRVLNREVISFVWESRHWMVRMHSRRLGDAHHSEHYEDNKFHYRDQAHDIINSVIKRVCPILGCWPAKVVFKQQKTRWGSCGINNAIHINWRLIFAPEEILEYVVIHELCHLLYRNHGMRFWKAVDKFFPDHLKARKWLRKEANFLMSIKIDPSFWSQERFIREIEPL